MEIFIPNATSTNRTVREQKTTFDCADGQKHSLCFIIYQKMERTAKLL